MLELIVFLDKDKPELRQFAKELLGINGGVEIQMLVVKTVSQGAFKWKSILCVGCRDLPCLNSVIAFLEKHCECAFCVSEAMRHGCVSQDAIVSLYQWCNETEKRDRAMREHFEMEKTQQSYNGFIFNVLSKRKNHGFDFMFLGYVADYNGIVSIYDSQNAKWLEKMREHSKRFLNTNSRVLLFCESETIYAN